jgi:hypothetical protein
MFVFPRGTAYREQWNVAFSAGEDESTWVARIGVGFYWAVDFVEAFGDYRRYQDRVRQNPDGFDRTFAAFGSYVEPPELRRLPLSNFVINDDPQDVPDWRFFGRLLRYADADDRAFLEDVGRFVREVIRVFDWIERSGFGV